jgi:hypothetical protein
VLELDLAIAVVIEFIAAKLLREVALWRAKRFCGAFASEIESVVERDLLLRGLGDGCGRNRNQTEYCD